ncbi:MAG: hypothetical protein K8S87_04535 [Planctomycetes bacterium]|nr:hypothetical protein [Planctomycetota bacterium]
MADIHNFSRKFLSEEKNFTKIGDGKIGGKASGLEFVYSQVIPSLHNAFDSIEINVPSMVVLTTEVFDNFMHRNDLYEIAYSSESDDYIANRFQHASFPAEFVGDLRALISDVYIPLAIRSSSLLEDELFHPFAGVYATKMIPNRKFSSDARFNQMVAAIKFVYASMFFKSAKNYIRSIGQNIQSEKMAVIIQEVVGQRFGDRYYPNISGVGRSYNIYPTGTNKNVEGVVNLALGLGKTIVDGGISWSYCPKYPRSPAPFNNIKDLLKYTQRDFWCINMGTPPSPDPLKETEYLVSGDLIDAEQDETLKHIVSSLEPNSQRFYPSLHGESARLLDFAPILQLDKPPLNEAIASILEKTKTAYNTDIEIEFAINIDSENGLPARIGFLQARPMLITLGETSIESSELDSENVIVATDNALGDGIVDEIGDFVYVKPENYDSKNNRKIAKEIAEINDMLLSEERQCILIGFGRWASSDEWYGIPVDWSQICTARVIVEANLANMNPEFSQGSHFFHNMLSFKVLYFSVNQKFRGKICWEWLSSQTTIHETQYVKHVRAKQAIQVVVDSRNKLGVIKYVQ